MPPPGISSLLIAQYDASTLGLSNGAAVGTWPDLSGHDYDLIDPGAADPTYVTPALNNMGGVLFNTAGARRRALSVDAYTEATFFVVGINPVNTGAIAYFNDQTSRRPFLAKWTQADRWIWGIGDSAGTFIEFTETGIVGQPGIWTGTIQSTGALLRWNQTQKVTGNIAGLSAATGLEIGSATAANWTVCEYLVYDGIVSGGDIDIIEDYLFAKWFQHTASGAISWAGVATGTNVHRGSATGSIRWRGKAFGPPPPIITTRGATPWVEVWTRPGDANYGKKIADLPIIESSVTVPYSGVGKGSMTVPSNYHRLDEILFVQVIDELGVGDVWSTIKVFDDTGWLYEWLPTPRIPAGDKAGKEVEFAGDGLESMWGFARVEPWDWDGSASFVSTFPDWIWGGRNLMQNPGFENSGESPIIDQIWVTGPDPDDPDIDPGGTFTISDGTNTTDPLDWDHTAGSMEGRIEDAGIYDDCMVSGNGTEDDPWIVEAVDPFEGVTLTVDGSGLTGGGATGVHIRRDQFGSLQPTGWTRSTTVSDGTPRFFGLYDSFRVTDNQAHSGTYSLQIEPAAPDSQETRYAGAQQVIQVKPNGVYQAKIWVYPTSATDTYRFVIRGIDGDFIKAWPGGLTSSVLTPNQWNELVIEDVYVGDNSAIIFRIATTVVVGVDPAIFYIDDAEFNEGMMPTTIGCMLVQLYSDAVLLHYPGRRVWENEAAPLVAGGVYLHLDFDCEVDSNGIEWDRLEVNQTFNPRMSYLQVIDQIVEEGAYDWRVVPDDVEAGTYLLQVYNPGDLGSVQAAGIIGGASDTQRQAKFFAPDATEIVAEGDANRFERATTPGLVAAYGHIEGSIMDQNWVTEGSVWSAARMALDEEMRGGTSIVYTLASPAQRPLSAYRPGDRIRVHDIPIVNEYRRVQQIQFSMSKEQPDQFVVHISDAIPFRRLGGAGPKLTRGLTGQAATDNAVSALLKVFQKASRHPAPGVQIIGGGGQPTITVAAANATSASKNKSDLRCEGTLDDQVIQQAFGMLGNRGGKVVLTEGTFNFGPVGVILPGVDWHLHGMGPDATQIVADEAADFMFIDGIFTSETRDQMISDIAFDGAGATVTAITNPSTAGGQNTVLVQNCHFHDFTSHGVVLPRPAGFWRFRHCYFYDNAGGGLVTRECGIDVMDSIFENNGAGGLDMSQDVSIRIIGNRFISNTGSGLGSGNAITQGISGCVISNNQFESNSAYGMDIQDGTDNLISGNYFSGNTSGSIHLGAGAFGVATIQFITGNIQDGAGTFVTIAAGSSAIQTNNVVNGTLVP